MMINSNTLVCHHCSCRIWCPTTVGIRAHFSFSLYELFMFRQILWKFDLFADDTALFYSSKNCFLVTGPEIIEDIYFKYKPCLLSNENCIKIKQVKNINYLWVLLDNNFNRKVHITNLKNCMNLLWGNYN